MEHFQQNKESFWQRFKRDSILANCTVMLVPHNGAKRPFQLKLPVGVFLALGVVLFSLLSVTTYFAYSSYRLRQVELENSRLNKISAAQEAQLVELESTADEVSRRLDELFAKEEALRERILPEEEDTEGETAPGLGGAGLPVEQTLVHTGGSLLGDSRFERRLRVLDARFASIEAESGSWQHALSDLQLDLEELDNELSRREAARAAYAVYLAALPSEVPLRNGGIITSRFGWRQNPFNSRTNEFHYGVDYMAAHGERLYAAGDGVVAEAMYQVGYGRTVTIDHGYGYRSLYAHCSAIKVKVGDAVKRGDLIALAGSTGRATGAHLHFGISYQGEWIDPETILTGE